MMMIYTMAQCIKAMRVESESMEYVDVHNVHDENSK